MELNKLQLEREYFIKKSLTTFIYGKLFAVGSLIIVSIIALLEYITHNLVSLLYCRLILIIPSATFLLLSFKVFKDKSHLILPFHILNLLGGISMIAGLAIVKSQHEYFNSSFSLPSITGGIVTVVFILFIFSSGAEKYLGYIVLIPILALIGYFSFWGKSNWIDISFFVNPLVAGIGASVYSLYQEKLQFQEFKMRKLAEKRKDLLEIEIKEKKLLEEKLRKLATYDDLTGVFNRRAGFELLNSKYCACKLALCYIDLDNLKETNDKYGHAVGDKMIITLCNTIKSIIRDDDFICRVGGDEFIVVFNNCTAEEVELAINRLKQNLKGNVHGFEIDFSYGVCEHATGTSTINQLIENADNRMYINKIRKKLS